MNDISVLDWQDVYFAANAQHAFSLFHKKLIDLHDSHFPEKSITKRYHTRKPWLTSCLRDAIRKKNKLYYKSVKIKCMRTRKEYELYRNQLRKLLRVAEKKHYADRISENKHNYVNPGYFSLAATALKTQQIAMFLHISTRVWGRRWSPHTSE